MCDDRIEERRLYVKIGGQILGHTMGHSIKDSTATRQTILSSLLSLLPDFTRILLCVYVHNM